MSGGLLPDCTEKDYPENTDLSSRCKPMHAHDLKNNNWCLDDKTGLPGQVSELKMSKTGKHGHAKFTYKLRMPHSGRASSLMHPGGDHLYEPVMEKVEYLISHVDDSDDKVAFVNCLDDNYEEVVFKLRKEHADYDKWIEMINDAPDKDKEALVTVLEGPQRMKGEIKILQIIQDVKLVDPK